MTRHTVTLPRVLPPFSTGIPQTVRITLPTPPFPLDIDPARRETAPRGPAIRNPDLDETRGPWAPAKAVRAVVKRAGIMDMGGTR
jgi:hypothetical protein